MNRAMIEIPLERYDELVRKEAMYDKKRQYLLERLAEGKGVYFEDEYLFDLEKEEDDF